MRADTGASGKPMMGRVTTLGLLVLAGAAGLLAQEAPTFPAQVEQVNVDVVVTDDDNSPVRGLTADDFVLEEDGVRQSIVSFEAIELPAEPVPMAPAPPRVSTNTAPKPSRDAPSSSSSTTFT